MSAAGRAIGSRFGTSFDAPRAKASLPRVIINGLDPTLELADGLTRSRSVVGRFSERMAILGLSVEAVGPVRVSLQLDADGRTGPTPRLIELRGAGGESSLAILDVTYRGIEGREPASMWLTISTEDLPADGLLLVEVREADPVLPAWAGHIRSGGPVGAQLLRLRIAQADDATGDHGGSPRPGAAWSVGAQVRSGLLIFQPPPGSENRAGARRIVLEPRLVPPWRRNRWQGPAETTADTPGPLVTGASHAVPGAKAGLPDAAPGDAGVASGRPGAVAGLRARTVSLTRSVAGHGRPMVARFLGQLDRLVPDTARDVVTLSTVRWLAGRNAIEARAASLASGADVPVQVGRHRGGWMTLTLPTGIEEPVLVGLRIKRGALPPIRMASGLILWSVGADRPGRHDASEGQPRSRARGRTGR